MNLTKEDEIRIITAMLDSNLIEKSPKIQQLKKWFEEKLPKRFGSPRIYTDAQMGLVIRSDCSNPSCSVRAGIHIKRTLFGWNKVESEPIFDRFQNPCEECKTLLNK